MNSMRKSTADEAAKGWHSDYQNCYKRAAGFLKGLGLVRADEVWRFDDSQATWYIPAKAGMKECLFAYMGMELALVKFGKKSFWRIWFD